MRPRFQFLYSSICEESWEYINRSQKHKYRNWERGRAVSFLGILKSDLVCSVQKVKLFLVMLKISLVHDNHRIMINLNIGASEAEPKCTPFMYTFFRGRFSIFQSLQSIPRYVHDIPALLSTLQNPKISCLALRSCVGTFNFQNLKGTETEITRCLQQKIRFTFAICVKMFNVECSAGQCSAVDGI